VRVVFDTNILVSALVFPGGRATLALQRVVEGGDRLVVSRAIISELVDVLGRKFARDAEALSRAAVFVADLGDLVEAPRLVTLLPDERDNCVLDCALAGAADLVVTGDGDLLALRTIEGIRIVSLRDYLNLSEGGA
jgi:putative PIN family toxin of toxin-antitoxin system